MRKSQPIELELCITDIDSIQDQVNSLLVEIIKYDLKRSSASHNEKIAYIDNIIKAIELKSD